MGRIGLCVPLHIMSVELAPHCWNATSFADPEYVTDFTSPTAFCALAITVFASCAIALPHRHATQTAITTSFFTTANSPLWNLGDYLEMALSECGLYYSTSSRSAARRHPALWISSFTAAAAQMA